MTRLTRCVAVLMSVIGTWGCGSAPAPKVTAPTYVERVQARIAAAQREPAVVIRYNPAPCGCPPYEVALDEVWHRAAFVGADPEDEAVLALQAATEAARGGDRAEVWLVQTDFDDALTTCGRGTLVVGLLLRAFGAGEETPEGVPLPPEAGLIDPLHR